MPGRRAERPSPTSSVSLIAPDDPTTARAIKAIEQAIQALQAKRSRFTTRASLIIGQNRVRHGLTRAAEGYTITPTAVASNFAHAIDTTNPNPELEIWITVSGTAQPDARIEVW